MFESAQLEELDLFYPCCTVLEFNIVRAEVPCIFCNSAELRIPLCNSVRVAKGIRENGDKGCKVGKVDSAIIDKGLDLISSIDLQVVYS